MAHRLATGLVISAVMGGVLLLAEPAHAAPVPSGAPTQVAPTPGPGIQVGPALLTPTSTGVPGDGAVAPTAGSSCGLIDVTCHVGAAIDGWFSGLVTSALTPVLDLLGRTVLATPDLTGGKVAVVWGVTAGIANALVVLLVLAGGAIVMGHETVQTRTTAKEVLPRIVVAVVGANASLGIAGLAIGGANALARGLLGSGVDPASGTATMRRLVAGPVPAGGTFMVLLGLVAAVLAVVLLVTYVVRVALLVVAVGAAPLALICHALPQTEALAKLWWRAIGGLLAIQLGQSLVLVCALRVFLTPDGTGILGLPSGGLVDMLVAICLLWVMIKIPAWVSRAIFGASRGSSVAKAFTVAVVYKVAKAAAAGLA